jgi:hypothetical protein
MNRYLPEDQKLQMFENKVLDDVNGHAPLLRILAVLIGTFVTHVGVTALTGFMFQCVMITCTNIPKVTSLN